jgi:hypothetical protein
MCAWARWVLLVGADQAGVVVRAEDYRRATGGTFGGGGQIHGEEKITKAEEGRRCLRGA